MEELTISAVAQQLGIRASTIRYYESISLLPAARRVNGRRRYDPSIIERLAFIHTTQQLGFTLTEIQRLFHHHEIETPLPQLWQGLARQKLADVERLIQHAQDIKQLLTQGLGCGCPDLQDCIDCVLAQCEEPQRY
jgi:MerR family redox-sensitive transcriptional activator SoxR